MKGLWSLFGLVFLGSAALAEEPPAAPASSAAPVLMPADMAHPVLEDPHPTLFTGAGPEERPGGFLTGNRHFPNFIGWLSNPLQNIDPRAVTEFWPLFGSSWTSAFPPLPSGN